jgi:hypothetical protein
LGVLASPAPAASPGCPLLGPSNIIALKSSVCTETASNVAFSAAASLPESSTFSLPIPYTGFAFFAFYGGTARLNAISVLGDNISITSYSAPNEPVPYPGEQTAPYGVFALGTSYNGALPSTVAFEGTTSVTTKSDGAFGLYARAGGAIVSTAPMTVTTHGSGASGVVADTAGLIVDSSDSPVIVPPNPGTVTLSGGGSVTTYGPDSAGLFATGTGSKITASGLQIATGGTDSYGAEADAGGVVMLSGGSVATTSGSGAIGLYALQGGAISATGTTSVTTSGLNAYGVDADGAGSMVNLASATVKTSGAGAIGLFASDAANSGAAGAIAVTGPLSVQTTNPSATAIALQGDGASFVATGGGTIASAGDAIAFLGGANQTATFDNFSIANQTGDLIFADPAVATVNFNNTTANAGTNTLLDTTGGSFVTLNASASALTGAIRTDAASTSTVNLTNGSTWTVTGPSAVTNLAVANSYVVFAPPGAGGGFKTLTLNNYVGSGGYVTMNAALGGTESPSDQIVINGGKATGSTLLTIHNVGGFGGQTTGAGIPVVVATNGGTIAPNAFALASTPVVGGYSYALEQSGQDLYLVSTPAATQAQIANSVTNVEKAQLQQLITGRVLGSILLGATEQVNCSNCSSGFGSIGSFALGAHGRVSLTPEVTAMGGFSYDEYNAQGIAVTNAPTFAGSLVYDPINIGRSRPFLEVGGGLVPFEQVRYSRTYPYGVAIAQAQANGVDRSLGLFGRVGWVDRVTPIDEAAVYTDISRSWLIAGGYTEAYAPNNPFPATVSTGLETLDVLRLGGQYTHLFGGRYEVNVSGAVAYGFNSNNSSQWSIADYGLVSPYPIGNSVWCEWGARVGYRLGQRMVVDAFVLGTLGGQIGTTIHGGVGLRYLF